MKKLMILVIALLALSGFSKLKSPEVYRLNNAEGTIQGFIYMYDGDTCYSLVSLEGDINTGCISEDGNRVEDITIQRIPDPMYGYWTFIVYDPGKITAVAYSAIHDALFFTTNLYETD